MTLGELLNHSKFVIQPEDVWLRDVSFTNGEKTIDQYYERRNKMIKERDEAISKGISKEDYYKIYTANRMSK